MKSVQYKVLVTGSRGKSSVVRLLHTAFNAEGISCYARITGVVPRELGPKTTRQIVRSAGAHVEEMRWWLNQLPSSAQAIILENSAVSPELQHMAARWLKPDVTVLTNTYSDHQEAWGPSQIDALNVLIKGISRYSRVVIPLEYKDDAGLISALKSRHCSINIANNPLENSTEFKKQNTALAIETTRIFNLDQKTVLKAIGNLKPDAYDFHVTQKNGAKVAIAFTANDVKSTQALFRSLLWKEEETTLLYNHRSDRPGRLNSFLSWISRANWRDVIIMGHKPKVTIKKARYQKIKNNVELQKLFYPGDQIFGCGNVSGIPLKAGLY